MASAVQLTTYEPVKSEPQSSVPIHAQWSGEPSSMIPKDNFGTHPGIQNIDPSKTRVLYKGEYDVYCCQGPCLVVFPERSFVYVLENGIERQISCIYRECYRPYGLDCFYDYNKKFYYDQEIFYQQGCARATGFISGKPYLFPGEVQYVCFCMDCPVLFNQCMACYFPDLCGDRIRYSPSEKYCCCFSTRADSCTNCCGIFGPKTGEPVFLLPFLFCLKIGTGQILAGEIEKARAEWSARTQLP